ncbi:MAG: hypothetical protein ACFFBH_01385 [Promethearchaeota archaeon]
MKNDMKINANKHAKAGKIDHNTFKPISTFKAPVSNHYFDH